MEATGAPVCMYKPTYAYEVGRFNNASSSIGRASEFSRRLPEVWPRRSRDMDVPPRERLDRPRIHVIGYRLSKWICRESAHEVHGSETLPCLPKRKLFIIFPRNPRQGKPTSSTANPATIRLWWNEGVCRPRFRWYTGKGARFRCRFSILLSVPCPPE